MSARSKARKRALDFLYEAEIKKAKAVDLFLSRGASELSQTSLDSAVERGPQ